MKTKVITTIMITLFLASMLSMAFIVPTEATPDSGIVGLWHFDEGTGSTAYDSSGCGNDGYLSGGAFGNALQFDGVDDYVVVADHPSLGGMTELTVEAWIKWGGSTGTAQYIVSKYLETGNQRGFIFGLHSDNTLRMWVSSDGTTASGKFDYLTSSYTPPVGSWVYVAGVFKGGSFIKLFVDGLEVAFKTTTVSSIFDNTDVLYIGRYFTDRYHKGSIDEVRISNTARTSFVLTVAPSVDTETVALWHFDESVGSTVYDETTNDNDGTIYGAKWAGPTWTTEGVFDAALEFDGTDDYVEVPYSTSLDITGEITIEAWVHAKGTGTMLKIACKRETQVPFYFIGVDGGKLYAGIGDDTSFVVTDKVTDLPLSEWHHVAMAYSDSENKIWLYLDGELEETKDCEISLPTFTTKLLIGAQYYNNQYMQFFNGVIDEVRIWNRVLTAEETKKHAWGLVGEWDFNEGSGTTAYDTSGFGNDGALCGDTAWETEGRYGSALRFDGDGDYVRILGSASLSGITSEITVEAWLKFDDVRNAFYVRTPYDSGRAWGLDRWGGKLRLHVYDGGLYYICEKSWTPSLDAWYHIAGTYDGSTLRLYLNGELFQSYSHVGDIDSTEKGMVMGARYSYGGADYHKGLIDEVRIWNQALIPVKFAQTGLDDSATGERVVVVEDPITLNYEDLPYVMMVESGTEVTYTYEQIVLSNIVGKSFSLDIVTGDDFPSDTITVTDPTTITGNYVTQIEASVDIDPDTLNLKSNGQWITAYITLPEGYRVEDIDPETVCLDGIDGPPAWSEIQDGVFMAKFDRCAVQGAIEDVEGYEEGTKLQEVTLTVTGKFFSGDLFQGSDTVRVIAK